MSFTEHDKCCDEQGVFEIHVFIFSVHYFSKRYLTCIIFIKTKRKILAPYNRFFDKNNQCSTLFSIKIGARRYI